MQGLKHSPKFQQTLKGWQALHDEINQEIDYRNHTPLEMGPKDMCKILGASGYTEKQPAFAPFKGLQY